MFLKQDEVARLTGKVRPSAQQKFLLQHGYKFEVNGLGEPIVLRSVVEQKLGGTVTPNKNNLNWQSLDG